MVANEEKTFFLPTPYLASICGVIFDATIPLIIQILKTDPDNYFVENIVIMVKKFLRKHNPG
jgi:hypothetical protein